VQIVKDFEQDLMTALKPKLYFDVSDTVAHAIRYSTVTGISRSVLKIIESAVRNDLGFTVYGLVRHPIAGKFVVADLSFMRGEYEITDFCARFNLPSTRELWLRGTPGKYRKRPLKRAYHYLRNLLQWHFSTKARERLAHRTSERKESCLLADSIAPGSVIVSLGAGWLCDYRGVHALAAARGCKTVSFVHDIFPLLPPKDTESAEKRNERFRDWLDFIAENSSLVMCISRFTRQQLMAYLGGIPPRGDIAIARFPHEFRRSKAVQHYTVRRDVDQIIKTRYALCVGTIQIRKNILKLLEAWQALQDHARELPHLVLAGGKGWGVDDVYKSLRKTSNAGGTVKIVDCPNDAELELLYQNCQFSVFPSKSEGWGLPIGESLWFGKPVICANNASMPEVGGPFAAYFDHAVPGSLLAALKSIIESPVALPKDIRRHLTSWNDTAASICAAIEALGNDRSAQGRHFPANKGFLPRTAAEALPPASGSGLNGTCARMP
jgi:glycosyltransferase involved in cell wall biosynthesis